MPPRLPTARSPRATISSWRRCIGAQRNGPMTRTTRPTSPTTTRSASATPNTRRSPTITSRRCGCRSRTRRFRPGCICRRIIPAAGCRSSSPCPGWTVTRKSRSRSTAIGFLNRGMAVLAIDGPGQYEAPMIGALFQHGELDGGGAGSGRLDRCAIRTRLRRVSASRGRVSARCSAPCSPAMSRA